VARNDQRVAKLGLRDLSRTELPALRKHRLFAEEDESPFVGLLQIESV
jgi:hypothetical protein